MSYLEPSANHARYKVRKGAPPDPWDLDRRLRQVLAGEAMQASQEKRRWSKSWNPSYQQQLGSVTGHSLIPYDYTKSFDLCDPIHTSSHQYPRRSLRDVPNSEPELEMPRQLTSLQNDPGRIGESHLAQGSQKPLVTSQTKSSNDIPALSHQCLWWTEMTGCEVKAHAQPCEPISESSHSSNECSKIELRYKMGFWQRIIPKIARRKSVWIVSSREEPFLDEKVVEHTLKAKAKETLVSGKGRRYSVLARWRGQPKQMTSLD